MTALAIGFVTRRAQHPRRHRDRGAVRGRVRPRRVHVQHDPGLRRRPVRVPVRVAAADRRRGPRRAGDPRHDRARRRRRCSGRSCSTRRSTRRARPRPDSASRRSSTCSWRSSRVTIVVSLQAVGIILVVAMLVTPAATAQLLTVRFGSLVAARRRDRDRVVRAGPVRLVLARRRRSGATIVLVQTALFLVALALGPRTGLLRRRRRRTRDGERPPARRRPLNDHRSGDAGRPDALHRAAVRGAEVEPRSPPAQLSF